MSFFDRVGHFFDKITFVDRGTTHDMFSGGPDQAVRSNDGGGLDNSPIGAAWTYAVNTWNDEDSAVGHIIKDPIMAGIGPDAPVGKVAGGAIDAFTWAYDKFARGASTVIQQGAQPTTITSAEAWREAWNRSEEISPGQAEWTAIYNTYNIGPNWAHGGDPFDEQSKADREDFYRNTWWGKISSGSTDAALIVASDPTYLVFKAGKALSLARATVKPDDVEAVLAHGVTGEAAAPVSRKLTSEGFESRRINRQGKGAVKLIDEIDATPMREIPAMPQLRNHQDAGSLAVLFQRAKELHPTDAVERRKAMGDILGTAWGDSASMARLTARRDELATDFERLASAPPQTRIAAGFQEGNGALHISDYETAADRAVEAKLDLIDDELDRLTHVVDNAGQGAATQGNRVTGGILDRGSQARAWRNINESWVSTGAGAAPLRFVHGALNTRVPQHIHIKNPSQGYDDMVNTLAMMRYTTVEDKKILLDSFVRASGPNQRMNAVDATRKKIFVDAARHHGLPEDQARAILAAGEGRMATIRNGMQKRLYSAANAKFAVIGDPEADVINIFNKPLLRTQLEDMHPVIDPREVERALKVASKNRLLDQYGPAGTWSADRVGGGKDIAADVVNSLTKHWKFGALARGAYPIRIQTDSQARQMAHMETMQFLATRYTVAKGIKRYLLSAKDGDGGQSLRNLFTEGDYREALKATLMRDVGDARFNFKEEELDEVVDSIISMGGGPADIAEEIGNRVLSRQREGNWVATQPGSETYLDDYLRVVNRQIVQSPLAMTALKHPDVEWLVKAVNKHPELRKEIRDLGVSRDNLRAHLQEVIDMNNHYLPTAALQRRMIGGPSDDMLKPIYDEMRPIRDQLAKLGKVHPLRANASADAKAKHAADMAAWRAKRKPLNDQLRPLKIKLDDAKKSAEYNAPGNRFHGKLNAQEVADMFSILPRKKLKTPGSKTTTVGADGKEVVTRVKPQYETVYESKVPPMIIHGESFSLTNQTLAMSKYDSVRNGWFKYAAEVPENIMARSPLFWDSYRRNVQSALAHLDEEQVTTIGVDVIRKNAMRNARKEVGQILFDASHASNMASSMRYMSPFFSAWEDTMTKWTKLFYDQPQLLPLLKQGSEALNDIGLVHDENGNRLDAYGHAYDVKTGERVDDDEDYEKGSSYVLLPKTLTKYVVKPGLKGLDAVVPGDQSGYGEGEFKIRKDSINSVFQGEPFWLPGFGPLVAVPTNHIVREMFPKEVDHPILKYVLPYGTTTESATDQLLPKYVRTAKNAFGNSRQFNNQYGIFLAEAIIDSGNGGKDLDLDKIKKKTRNYFILKAFTDNASPVSFTPTPKNQLFIDMAHKYRADPDRKDWKADYLKDFPGFFEMTVSLSANATGIQATDAAYDARKKFKKAIDKDPPNGWLMIGPANAAGPFNGAVYDNQVISGDRTQREPWEALRQVQAEKGWMTWNAFRTQVNQELEKRGLVSTRQKGAEDLAWAMGKVRESLAAENEAWGSEQGGMERGGAGKMIKTAQDFLKDYPSERTRPDMVALQKYMDFRVQIKTALAERENSSLQYNPDLEYALDYVRQDLVKNNIGFEAMFNRGLEFDDLTDIDVEEE